MDNLDALSSDEEIYEQNGGDMKFVRDGEVEVELENKELMFKFCSDGCMDQTVIACYDSTNSNALRQGDCDPGQCEFKAGVSEKHQIPFLWFKDDFYRQLFPKDGDICETAIMKWPDATVSFSPEFSSCDPSKHDGNVVNLYVRQVPPGCHFYVLNAKKWVPPPPPTTSELNSTRTVPNQTTSKSSEANTTLWVVIGVGIFILLIVVIGFGYCCYRTIQKKPLFGNEKDVQRKADIPQASKKESAVENEKTPDEKQVLKSKEVVAIPEPSKESTVEKEKQPKPAKKKAPKEKKAPVVEEKPSKEFTGENGTKEDAQPKKKVSIEPTLQDATTEASVVQKRPGNPPRVFVPKKVIFPAKNSDGLKSVSLFDTLSGAEDDKTQNSTHTSEKPRKNESAGRKKGSKKHR
uniref:Uncharacterized protein n=1 Tax=Panagrolaimus davidi TaxID=227884 RepID=A0A914PUI7_9BILA